MQACRVLHAFVCSDYVWHRISIDVPIDILPDVNIVSLPSSILQPIIIKALRLDDNWRKREPDVRYIMLSPVWVLNQSATIGQLQFIGKNHVLSLSRCYHHHELSFWSLEQPLCTQPNLTIRTMPMIRFSVTMFSGDSNGVIVFLGRDEKLYTISLKTLTKQPSKLPNNLLIQGRVSTVETCDHIIATLVAQISPSSGSPRYTVVFHNLVSSRSFIYHYPVSSHMCRLQMRLYPSCFVIVQCPEIGEGDVLVHVHALPPKIRINDSTPLQETTVMTGDECRLLAEHVLSRNPGLCEWFIPDEPVSEFPSHLPLIIFQQLGGFTRTIGLVYQIPMNIDERTAETYHHKPTHTFSTEIETTPQIVCIGKTGLRAVWLDKQFENEGPKLWKATFQTGMAAAVTPLVAPHQPLPFEARMVSTLRFEEATGRVAVGLWTGAVYILEF
ncbi:hypothetical protein AMATHDRAFT_1698 [Amanita thiersii Skay4041]|uniref:F-box domain-containing protein n=1 Tax=Amanita thiersii Skay4041 TaxID=703135 RepID=A0A2A9NYC9_9AGAR|nr:hypothetical protein AMATHDRAFT_1698 [Amanita thiersii Skay4041]